MSTTFEMDKLAQYLEAHNIRYKRKRRFDKLTDEEFFANGIDGGEIIIVYDSCGKRQWDAIWGYGSYGYIDGLLEIMGSIVKADDANAVEGWLTSEDIIDRLEDMRCR
ncbi:MAG: hypothetical protein LUD50_02595 [Clostridia bacterium]|nr:hypothetical protein [Clostridia bacterium]